MSWAASALAAGPTVTYVLSMNDDGQGNNVPGSFAIYAIDSTADGNQGMASYSVDVQGFATLNNVAPQAFYPSGTSTISEGFTVVRSANNIDPVRGSQDTFSTNRTLVYGMGQTGGNLDALAPNGGAGGTNKVQPVYNAPLLVATGTFTTPGSVVFNSDTSFDHSNVFLTNTGTTTEAATIQTVTAMTDTYVGPTGAWSTGGNWSPQAPQQLDNALITGTSAGSVTVTYDATASALPFNRITVDGTGGAMRTLAQTANTFTTTHEYVGLNGVGALSITGGTHNVVGAGTNGLYVGLNAGSSGTVTLGGTGALNLAGTLNLGVAGNATFNQTGGSLTAAATVNNGAFNQTGGTASLGPVIGSGSMSIGGAGSALATVTSFAQSSVTIGDGGKLQVTQATSAVTNTAGSLTITGSGTLDLANHSLLVTTTSNVASYVARAAGPVQANGLNAWTGSGITSSLVQADAATGNTKQLAVGYFDSRDNANTGLSVPAGQTLVKETVYGDATGDGKVNIADLSVWNNNFGVANPRWSQGDFNYDGKVNIADLSVWNNNFGGHLSGPTPPSGAVASAASVKLTSSSATPSAEAATPPAGTLELDIDPSTGDAKLNSGGLGVAAIEIDSASGVLLPAGWKSLKNNYGYTQWAFPRGTPNASQIAEFVSDPSPSGQPANLAAGTVIDYGDIFPAGFTNVADLTFSYNLITDPTQGLTATRTGVIVVPEPTGLALAGVAAAGLLGRKRRRRA